MVEKGGSKLRISPLERHSWVAKLYVISTVCTC